ncbi:MAG TPA: glycosyltransferase family 9 protein [Caulobacteraceae bacterium]|jgi:ADP-heptose:LPS heptosyltransferase
MASKPFPILFITSTRIGDAVLSSGLLKKLVDEIPHARFTVAAGPAAAPLFRDVPRLDQLIAMEKRGSGLHWLDLWSKVRRTRWGLVVDVRGSGLSAALSAKVRAVYKSPGEGAEPEHKVVEMARLLKVADDPPSPHIFVSDETQADADRRLGDGGPILALAPGANWIGKRWPSERFSVLATRILGRDGAMSNGRLLLVGGPEDRRAAEAVRRELPRKRVIDTTGEVDLLTVQAMLKRARLFIGNDSGLMHMSAAAGTPTLGLFGPSDERRYGPWGANARALRGPRSFDAYRAIDPQLNQSLSHMADLSVERVMGAAKRLLADTEPKGDSGPEPEAAPEPQPDETPAESQVG